MGFRVVEYVVESEKIPGSMDGYRMAVLADLHDCAVGRENQWLLAALRQAQPDRILLAGDMITEHTGQISSWLSYRRARDLLLELAREFPIYYAMGNHESRWKKEREGHSYTFERYRRELENAGIVFLDNLSAVLGSGRQGIRVTGLELPLLYYRKGLRIPKLTAAAIRKLAGPADEEYYQILLAHTPQFFQAYADWGADLVLAGHFHGGMVRLPLVGGVMSTYYRPFPRYDRGRFWRGERQMIVSAGLGTHTIPLRLNNPPELLMLTLRHRG